MRRWGGYGNGNTRPSWWEEWQHGIGIIRESCKCFVGFWTI